MPDDGSVGTAVTALPGGSAPGTLLGEGGVDKMKHWHVSQGF